MATRRFLFVFGIASLFLVSPLFLAACDGGDVSGSVETLLSDARIARQAGDIDGAIALLEEAMAQDPGHAPVRVELSSAYLDRNGIDLLDLDRVALFLTTIPEGATEAPPYSNLNGGATCQYADNPDATPFDPSDYEEYATLFGDSAVIDTVLDLLNGSGAPNEGSAIIPDELRVLSLCSGIVDGQIIFERDGALASMHALGLTDDEITTALAVNAVARFFEAYFFIVEDIPQQTSWYQIENGDQDYIGVCVDDPEALRVQVEEAIRDLGESITSLDLRDHVLGGGTVSQDLVQHVLDAYESVEGDLGPYCDGSE